jgi:tetratricopeptide (TPR) repeat protein
VLQDREADSTSSEDSAQSLSEVGQPSLGAIAEAVRTDSYAGRIRQALDLLDSEATRALAARWTRSDRARLELLRAQALQIRTMLARCGHEEALAITDQVKREADRIEDPRLLADARCLEAWLTINRELGSGRSSDAALPAIETCLRLRRELEDGRGVAEAVFLTGLAREHVSDVSEADIDEVMALYRESYRLAVEEQDKRIQSYGAYHTGTVQARRGELDEALGCFEEAYALRSEIGMAVYLPGPRLAIGRAFLAKGDLEKAEAHCREALRLADAVGHHAFRFFALMGLGDIAKRLGRVDEARSHFEHALVIGRKLEHDAFVERARRALDALCV